MNKFHKNVTNGRKLIQQILNAVRSRRLIEPFYPAGIREAVPGWKETTYKSFPWKHCLQNPNLATTPLFYYVGSGIPRPREPPYEERKYRLLRKND